MKPVFVATASAAVALAVGCSGSADSEEPQAGCPGEPRPVTEEVLVRTLARRGFELSREDEPCAPGEIDPVATLTNITDDKWDTDEGDVIRHSDGWVTCYLHTEPRFSKELRRSRIDEDVQLLVLNVECLIEATDAWQIERLQLAVAQLERLPS